ncbi:hypothetical protein L210DRAFT_1039870 [Boletus edulis BED1]|uniref:Uncharacterized protein n=1 Tax=Boletus edulis BED1 TaxID=1328754 RepID=A0AAD4BQ15_BOLED|nr:hypothetical protein L210DRAFT_1039870 [Boletus edulis BED1]
MVSWHTTDEVDVYENCMEILIVQLQSLKRRDSRRESHDDNGGAEGGHREIGVRFALTFIGQLPSIILVVLLNDSELSSLTRQAQHRYSVDPCSHGHYQWVKLVPKAQPPFQPARLKLNSGCVRSKNGGGGETAATKEHSERLQVWYTGLIIQVQTTGGGVHPS